MEILDKTENSSQCDTSLSGVDFPQADAFILCISETKDLKQVEHLIGNIQRACEFRPLPVIIVSTKSDVHGDAVEDVK